MPIEQCSHLRDPQAVSRGRRTQVDTVAEESKTDKTETIAQVYRQPWCIPCRRWPLRCPIGDRGNLCQYETATSHRVQSDSGKTARQERALDHEVNWLQTMSSTAGIVECNCVDAFQAVTQAAASQGDTRAARHRSRFSRSRRCTLPLGEVPRRSAPRHATPSKWGGRCRAQNHRVHSGAHRGVKRCTQLRGAQRHHRGESGSRTTPRPSATIALRVEHFVVGKQWCIEVREVQPERALAQSLVKSLRIPPSTVPGRVFRS